MHRMSVAAACAAMLFALSIAAASADTPAHSWTKLRVTVGIGPEGHRVIVTTNFEKTGGANPLITSYAYNPDIGNITHLPQVVENTNPNSGIGIVVKKNSGSGMGAALNGPDAQGTWAIDPASLIAGNYNIVVTVPAHIIISPRDPQSGLPKQRMLLTFHVVADADGNMTIDPKMLPSVKPAPATQ